MIILNYIIFNSLLRNTGQKRRVLTCSHNSSLAHQFWLFWSLIRLAALCCSVTSDKVLLKSTQLFFILPFIRDRQAALSNEKKNKKDIYLLEASNIYKLIAEKSNLMAVKMCFS